MAFAIPQKRQQLAVSAGPSLAVLVFSSLDIFALVLVALVLVTALASKRIHRNKTWYLYMFSQLLFAIAFLLHPFKSSQFRPTFVPCLVQSMLLYSTPPTASWAFFSLVVELYLVASGTPLRKAQFVLLFSVPIFVLIGISTVILVMGLKNPSLVKMGSAAMYCTLNSHTPSQISAFACLIGVTIDLFIFSMLAFRMYRHWKDLAGRSGLNPRVIEVSLSTTIRVGVLIFIPILGFFLAVVHQGTIPQTAYAGWNCVFPVVPIVSALVFGTQKDMLSATLCIKRRKAPGLSDLS
ncbi:hypothetical protein BDN72DRAFT_176808 [Pluteus cervinus]|uniref:Uncharacterized protein n=1 Tax=Pluteus cervinus TaxID=181527 RepID=A0ACD3AKV2_9AGAR|nr:hypothetical protein BDN72DRAFT_176808 [Pluteus cervinus]